MMSRLHSGLFLYLIIRSRMNFSMHFQRMFSITFGQQDENQHYTITILKLS